MRFNLKKKLPPGAFFGFALIFLIAGSLYFFTNRTRPGRGVVTPTTSADIVSKDEKLTLTIPEGAVSERTTVSIDSIESIQPGYLRLRRSQPGTGD